MKTKLTLFLVLLAVKVFAQTDVNKTIAFQSGQTITMHFDYPKLIKVSTWDKNEISIQGMVSINAGESDDAFELITSNTGSEVTVRNEIHNMKNLPQRITVNRDGQKMVFKTKADYKKWADQNGKDYNMMSCGLDMDIVLEIKVPRNVETYVESVYGMVEVKEFSGPLKVEATYGGVDAAVSERSTGEITAETNYGQIYSNLETKFGGPGMKEEDFHMVVSSKPGNGPQYRFESKYGNVYLRKAAMQ